jgi:hypothetical protein
MKLDKDDLTLILEALEQHGDAGELMDVIASEIELIELAEVDFDEDDGCAGGACKL